MIIQGWPFLVSCNKEFGYKTVVSPRFLCDAQISHLLALAAGGELTEVAKAKYCEVRNSKVGNFALIFRIIRAEKSYIGLNESDLLRDSYGRPINLIEGIVIEGVGEEGSMAGIKVTKRYLDRVHQQMKEAYHKFWSETVNIPAVEPSEPFDQTIVLIKSNTSTVTSSSAEEPNPPLELLKEPPF